MLEDNRAREEFKKKARKMPLNNLDSAWLSAEPDYTELQNGFKDDSFSKVFDMFNSSIRLGNIPTSKAKLIEYDLVSAGEALNLGYPNLALSIFYDVASIVEVSHGVKGFRTKAMNMIIQEITQKQDNGKSGIMGGKKNE